MMIRKPIFVFPFLLVSSLASESVLVSVDEQLTLSLQGNNSHPVLDYVMECITLGSPVVEFGWAWHQWRYEQSRYDHTSGRLFVEAWLGNALTTGILKYTINRKRPRRAYQPRLWNSRITPSFPSGHVASSALFATIVADRYPGLTPAVTVYALASAYSQVYVGNHYLGDVLGAAALGIIVGKVILARSTKYRTSPADIPVKQTALILTISIPLLSNKTR